MKWIVVPSMALWLTVSASVDALSFTPSDDPTAIPAANDSGDAEKKRDAEAKAAYVMAENLEMKIGRQLDDIERIGYTADGIQWAASSVASSLKEAERARNERSRLLALLPQIRTASLERRRGAMAAIDAYRQTANDTVNAIAAYAVSDDDSAAEKGALADAAMTGKIEMKRRAESAIAEAAAADNELKGGLAEIRRFHAEVRRHLLNARNSGSSVVKGCALLAEMAKGQKPGLAATVQTSLAAVRQRGERFVKHIADAAPLEEAYGSLIDRLEETGGDPVGLSDMYAYFEGSVHAAVKNESLLFLTSAQDPGEPGKETQAEAAEGATSLKSAVASADAWRKRVADGITAVGNDQPKLASTIQHLPSDESLIASLLEEGSMLTAGFDPAVKAIDQTLEEKEKEYAAARDAADTAFFLAFGRERRGPPAAAMAAAPKPPPPPAMEPSMRVEEHVYTHYTALRGEPANYGAYTYVLFRQNYATAQNHVKVRYKALLDALYRSTSSAETFSAPVQKAKLNIFCIPFRNEADSLNYDDYDADLARSYLATAGSGAILRRNIVSLLRKSPGPFLLTTRTRLSEGGSKTQLLFVDLSLYPADAFDSILAAYKDTIVETPPAGQVVWTPPVTKRIVYAGISVSDAVPGLMDRIKKVLDFFVPSAHAGQ